MEIQKESRTLKVLIVEDETHLLEALRDLFDTNYEVTAFSSIEEAVNWIHAGHKFDVILSDLNLPKKTGRDLYMDLKARGKDEESKIIFMTGGIFTADLAEWFASIPNEKFEKPFNINKLRELLIKLA